MTHLRWLSETLADLREKHLFRHLRTVTSSSGPWVEYGGRRCLNLASNNYLDLAGHPRVAEATIKAIEQWGWGSGAAALVSGWTALHEELAARLAAYKGAADCVLFPTGYQANLGALSLVAEGDRLIMDKLSHASLIEGGRLSRAEMRVYPHVDMAKLQRLLNNAMASANRRQMVATDTIFSMDGDCAPLAEIDALCRRHDSLLLLDDAHGTGVMGESGAGAVETLWHKLNAGAAGKLPEHIVCVATLSKAFGSIGGFVAASREICDYIRNRGRAFIYTTALPPAAAAASLAALEVMQAEPWRRQQALDNARHFRDLLQAAGIPVAMPAERRLPPFLITGQAAIVSLVVGEAEQALRLAGKLEERNILCPAIRPPTVPLSTSRLRFSWTAGHTLENVVYTAEAVLSELGIRQGKGEKER